MVRTPRSPFVSSFTTSLKRRAGDFDPRTRDRFRAGALIPASHYLHAQRFRAWFKERVREVFRDVDVVLAPTTPFPALRIGAPGARRCRRRAARVSSRLEVPVSGRLEHLPVEPGEPFGEHLSDDYEQLECGDAVARDQSRELRPGQRARTR